MSTQKETDTSKTNDAPAKARKRSRPKGRQAARAANNGNRSGKAAPFRQGTADGPYPYEKSLDTKKYRKTLRELQIELLKVQNWVKEKGEKVVIIFEGRDAAGKGGTIKRFTEHLNPRGARVVALDKPSSSEQGQWYFQRYIAQLPTAGEIVFFDRSWYNRAGVEPVMGYCDPKQYLQFMRQVPNVERGLVDSKIRLIKLWFDVGQEEQRRRIESRRHDPLKHWKLSPMDFASMEKWDEYTMARDSMFFYSHTAEAPWTVVRSDDKKRARIHSILTVLNLLPYPDKDAKVVVPADPLIVGPAPEMFPIDGRLIFNVVRT